MICPECKRALGHRPRDCHERVSRGGEIVGSCECRCRDGEVPLDVSGFYWPIRDARRERQPPDPPVYVWARGGGRLVEPSHPAAYTPRAKRPRRSRPSAPPPAPVAASAPPPVSTVLNRRDLLIADNLTEFRKRRKGARR